MSGGAFNYQNNSYAIDILTTELKYIGINIHLKQ